MVVRIRIFMCTGLCLLPAVVDAEGSSSRSVWRERSVLAADRVVQGDYMVSAPRVVISGTVNGDVYAAGGRILVDGTINGDLIAAGGKIIVSGMVAQNARLAGGHIVLSGNVGRNATVAATDIQLTDVGQIHGNVLAAAGDVELEGSVGRDAKIAARKVRLSNHVGGNLDLAAGDGQLTSTAAVEGKLRYWGDAPAIDEGAMIRGAEIHRPFPEGWEAEGFLRGLVGLRVTAAVISFASTLILGLVLLRIYPVFTRRVTSTIRGRPLRSLGWGTAALTGVPIVAMIFVVTLLGLPIGVILLALYLVMLYLARIYTMTWVGQVLLRRTSDSSPLAWSFIAGLGIYTLLSLIPIVGGLVTFVTVLFGLGALLLAEKDLVAALRKEQVV